MVRFMGTSDKKSSEKKDPLREALRGTPKRTVSDIVPRLCQPASTRVERGESSGGQARPSASAPPEREKGKEKKQVPLAVHGEAERTGPPPEAPLHEAHMFHVTHASVPPAAPAHDFLSRPHVAVAPARPRSHRSRAWLVAAVFIIVLGGGVPIALAVLPRATIVLSFTKTPVTVNESVRVDSKASAVQAEGSRIIVPGEILTARKNIELSFPASGKKNVSVKAVGKLTLFNAYGSAPQILVAGTRVESPDGKIFRLDQKTTVPGAEVVNGKIVPSSVDVAVTADGAGDGWNVSAAKAWHIPGFKGTLKYDGFYGESAAPMAGGFVGERAVPTDADVAAARTEVRDTLEDALTSQLLVALSDNLKVLGGTRQFTVVREEVRTDGPDAGTFSFFGEAELRELAFVDSMLQDAIRERAARALPYSVAAKDANVSYGTPQVDAGGAAMNFTASGSLTLVPEFNADTFRASILGSDEQALNAAIFSLPGRDTAQTSLWPFWVHRVPTSAGKVKIAVE